MQDEMIEYNGYRAIAYKQVSGHGFITLLTWDKDGNRITVEKEHRSYLYVESSQGDFKSIFGKTLAKIEFNSSFERKKWLERNPNMRIYECLPPTREFLLQEFEGKQDSSDFTKNPLKVQFIDIEIAVEEEFPTTDKAAYPINVITIQDKFSGEYHVFVLSDKKKDFVESDEYWSEYKNLHFHVHKTETDLLWDFLKWFAFNRPDVISGWNTYAFDIPYLVKRCYNLFDEDTVNAAFSPVGSIFTHEREIRGEFRPFICSTIHGVSQIDYMLIYKHKFPHEPRPNYKLETIGQEELGYGKLSHEKSFRDFYKNDFRRFVKYNIHDVKLVVELDAKLDYIALVRSICSMGLCEYESIYGSAQYILGTLILEGRKQGELLPSKNGDEISNTQEMIGAFVYPTIPGIYRDGLAVIDFNSLYPNIMATLNISPETKFGKIVSTNSDGSIMIKLVTDKTITVKPDQMEKLYAKCTKAPNGVFYINHDIKMGLIPKTIIRMYDQRKACQKEMKELKKKNDPQYANRINYLNCTQYCIKVFANSIFGQVGSAHFPLFDADNFNAVTAGGQHMIKESIKFVEENLGQGTVVAGDTDSIFFKTTSFIKGREFDDDGVAEICKDVQSFIDTANDNCVRISKDDFKSPLNKRLKLGFEIWSDRASMLAMKMYLCRIRYDDGLIVKPKWKIRGIDIRRGDLPKEIKDILKEIIFSSTEEHWPSNRYVEAMRKAWEKFKMLSPNDVAPNKGYNSEKGSEGFLQVQKGSTNVSKAVTNFNHIIDHLGLKGRYEQIKPGNKVKVACIISHNAYGIDVLAWNDEYPEEFKSIFQLDYITMFDKTVVSPLKHFIELNNWPDFDPTHEIEFDIMNL